MIKDALIIIGIVVLGLVLYGLTLRGAWGNHPPPSEIRGWWDQAARPLELSPERGRFVHVVNMAEEGTYALTKEWAAVAYPDVGVSSDGRYYAFFAAGVPYLTLPFYLLGSDYNLGQVAAFAAESLVSIVTLIFIFLIGRRIFELPRWAAFFAVLVYGFASTSWSYSITLYQHAFTTFFIVTGFYAAWRFFHNDSRFSFLYAAYVWLAYALAIFVDYPNIVLMLPVMIYFAFSTLHLYKGKSGYVLLVRWAGILSLIVFIAISGLHLAHNANYHGAWNNLPGTLKSVKSFETEAPEIVQKEKSVARVLKEKNMPESFHILFFSDERGLFYFMPIFLLSLLGIAHIFGTKKKSTWAYATPAMLVATNILFYCAWGDPQGGWAYGPRYLIPSMPWLALFVAVGLSYGEFSLGKKFTAFLLFLYSSAIALLGALTTNAVPTKGEGILLPAGKYNYLYNLNFFTGDQSGSFAYNAYFGAPFGPDLTLFHYFVIIYTCIALIAAITLFWPWRRELTDPSALRAPPLGRGGG